MVTRSGSGHQFGLSVEVFLDHAPVDRVVHVVEDVDVADPDGVGADVVGVLAAARLQVGLPPQPVDVGGALQTRR